MSERRQIAATCLCVPGFASREGTERPLQNNGTTHPCALVGTETQWRPVQRAARLETIRRELLCRDGSLGAASRLANTP